ncbi:LOW QUALITY PROTEIN: hypothetical protein HID58_032343 [Brassica napus]|uniref:Uncharacterized protein n=1 Tax=Brassica napus TaxID=3708 RepID=A0ABQ8BX07_BRANA|nr:LOW QUALITY PROTEIN: hypothetical protein HID58_032343 [Brassica napus]
MSANVKKRIKAQLGKARKQTKHKAQTNGPILNKFFGPKTQKEEPSRKQSNIRPPRRTRVKRESSPLPEEPRRSSAIGGDKSVKDQLSSLHRRPRRNRIITSGKITAVYNQSNHCDRGSNRESVVDRRTGSNNQTKPEELRAGEDDEIESSLPGNRAGEVDAERVTATRKQSRRRRCDRIISFRRQKPAKLVLNEPPLSGNRADRPPKEKRTRTIERNLSERERRETSPSHSILHYPIVVEITKFFYIWCQEMKSFIGDVNMKETAEGRI